MTGNERFTLIRAACLEWARRGGLIVPGQWYGPGIDAPVSKKCCCPLAALAPDREFVGLQTEPPLAAIHAKLNCGADFVNGFVMGFDLKLLPADLAAADRDSESLKPVIEDGARPSPKNADRDSESLKRRDRLQGILVGLKLRRLWQDTKGFGNKNEHHRQ